MFSFLRTFLAQPEGSSEERGRVNAMSGEGGRGRNGIRCHCRRDGTRNGTVAIIHKSISNIMGHSFNSENVARTEAVQANLTLPVHYVEPQVSSLRKKEFCIGIRSFNFIILIRNIRFTENMAKQHDSFKATRRHQGRPRPEADKQGQHAALICPKIDHRARRSATA